MTTFPVYCDTQDIQNNSGLNLDFGSLVGLNTTLAASVAAGASSFSVVSATGAPTTAATVAFQVWLLDGLNSEVVTGTLTSTIFTLSAGTTTAAAHSAGVSVSSAGVAGCLARTIASASRMVDQHCRQGPTGAIERHLYAIARTETYSLATTRAFVDATGTLQIWPYHFPVQSAQSLSVSLQLGVVPGNSVNLSALVLPEGARSLAIPSLGFSGPNTLAGWSWIAGANLRAANRWAVLTYTAGPVTGATLSAVPYDIAQATYYFCAHILGYKQNPVGAASITQGEKTIEARLRGDTSGKSLYILDAEALLQPYTLRP